MKLTLVLAMMTVLFGCATTNQRGLSDAWKPQRSPLRFPRLGEARRDMVSGPMARAVAVAGMETKRYVEERRLPACFGTPDGTDFLVSDAEVTLDGSKKTTRVFYVMAIPNPQRCKVPEDVAFDLEGLDYIINERGELLKAARIQHSQ